MSYSVYKATSPSGKIYIGMTTQAFCRRKSAHKYLSKRSNTIFYKAIRKYGFEKFSWEVMYRTDNLEELGSKESEFIEFFKSDARSHGYNQRSGGQVGWKYSPEVREKMAAAKRGKKGRTHAGIKVNAFRGSDYLGQWNSITECAKAFGVDQGLMSRYVQGKRENSKGLTFEKAL